MNEVTKERNCIIENGFLPPTEQKAERQREQPETR
jgi:hypothetical protein